MRELDKDQKEYVVGLFNEYYNKFTVYDGGGCYDINWSKKLMTDHLKEKGLVEKFEEGWYIDERNRNLTYLKQESSHKTFGIVSNFGWVDNVSCRLLPTDRKATDKEVEEALIKEAKKKGFKEGQKLLLNDSQWNIKNLFYEYYNNQDPYHPTSLQVGNAVLFENGKWAEILSETKKMTVEQVEKELGYSVEIIS